ncbi:hypothetical protein A3711_02855 [Erythrobacter sp. HI00D59]|nr:hypothetical protein A3711_02855 [Erythrobacter sp. HI00D59]
MAATQGVAQVVGNSEFMIERHRDHGLFTDVPCRTIFNAVPGIEKWPPARPEPKRGEPIRFGFMGMIKPEKGIELLLGSLDALPRRDWNLAIAGVGGEDYCSALQARFAHLPVEWLGFVRTEQFYPMIDTLVIPSIWPEPMPRTLIEAAAARVPAIVSDAGGSAEVAAMFPSARVYSSQDVAALTAELDAACSAGPIAFNPPAPEVLETFTPARLAANYEEVFREASQERAQP